MDLPAPGRGPRRNQNLFLLVSNGVLAVFALGFIWTTSALYRQKESEISLSESRFITTEWNLMQTLKINTDRQLMDKEREILELRQRYQRLVQNPDSAQGLEELRNQLNKAEEERRDLLSLRIETPGAADPKLAEAFRVPQATQSSPLSDSVQPSLTNALLQHRIELLQAQLADEQSLALALSDALSSLSAEHERIARTLRAELAAKDAAIARLGSAGRDAVQAIQDRSRTVTVQKQSVALDLKTKALLRALASSPEIRSRYPELLASLDSYLERLSLLERLNGQAEAYSSAASILKPLERELNQE